MIRSEEEYFDAIYKTAKVLQVVEHALVVGERSPGFVDPLEARMQISVLVVQVADFEQRTQRPIIVEGDETADDIQMEAAMLRLTLELVRTWGAAIGQFGPAWEAQLANARLRLEQFDVVAASLRAVKR